MKNNIFMILTAILLVVVGVLVFLLLNSKPEEDSEKNSSKPEVQPIEIVDPGPVYEFQVEDQLANLQPEEDIRRSPILKYSYVLQYKNETLKEIIEKKENEIKTEFNKYFVNQTKSKILTNFKKNIVQQDLLKIANEVIGAQEAGVVFRVELPQLVAQ